MVRLAAALARDGYIVGRGGGWLALHRKQGSAAKTSAWQDGLCQVQDESSMASWC